MKEGDSCRFIAGDMAVRCECWIGYDNKVTYGNTFYEVNDMGEMHEVMHAGHGRKIDTFEKAVEAIRDINEFRKVLTKHNIRKKDL